MSNPPVLLFLSVSPGCPQPFDQPSAQSLFLMCSLAFKLDHYYRANAKINLRISKKMYCEIIEKYYTIDFLISLIAWAAMS